MVRDGADGTVLSSHCGASQNGGKSDHLGLHFCFFGDSKTTFGITEILEDENNECTVTLLYN